MTRLLLLLVCIIAPAVALPAAHHRTGGGALGTPAAVSMPALTGTASWYTTPGLTAAAGPALRSLLGHWRGTSVLVCSERCVVVVLTDACGCVVDGSRRVLDLSDGAFRYLAPLSRGLVLVTVSLPPALPATDR